MKKKKLNELTSEERELIRRASKVKFKAHAPYSKFKVGAAVLCDSGEIYVGVNVENAAYPTCICAEISAISSAIVCGESRIVAVAINAVAENGNTAIPTTPCGNCRQFIREFADPNQCFIYATTTDMKTILVCALDELLHESFGPENL